MLPTLSKSLTRPGTAMRKRVPILSLPVAAAPVAAVPEEVQVQPSAPNASTGGVTFKLSGDGLHECTVREVARFVIEAVDASSGARLREQTGLTFSARISGVMRARARVTDEGDGSYTVEWRPPCSGRFLIFVSHGGTALPGSPFTASAATPEPCPSKCTVRGDALIHAVSRAPQTFEVAFRDKVCHAHPARQDTAHARHRTRRTRLLELTRRAPTSTHAPFCRHHSSVRLLTPLSLTYS